MLDSDSPWRRDLLALLRLTGPVAAARLGVMAMGLKIAGIEVRHAEKTVIARRHLLGIGAFGKPRPADIQVPQKFGIVGVENENAHRRR